MNTPTKITTSRIVLIVAMLIGLFVLDIVCMIDSSILTTVQGWTIDPSGVNIHYVYLIVAIVFVIASFTDFLDGYLARKNNQVTDLGKFLDPVADKLLVNSIIIYLVLPHAYAPNQLTWPWFSAVIIVARDIVVDALRFIAANKKQVIAANIFGKAKTVLQMVAIPVLLINGWPFSYINQAGWHNDVKLGQIFVYLATIVSLLSGIIYVVQNIHVFKESKVPELIKICKENKVTFGSVESITGGSFASEITKVSGSSNVYKGSVISYATELKEKIVGVNKEIIDEHTVVSEEVALEMAKKGRELLGVDYCVSCTGNAGPSVCEGNMPVGRVYLALSSKEETFAIELNLKGKRIDIQNKTVEEMVNIIYNNIIK